MSRKSTKSYLVELNRLIDRSGNSPILATVLGIVAALYPECGAALQIVKPAAKALSEILGRKLVDEREKAIDQFIKNELDVCVEETLVLIQKETPNDMVYYKAAYELLLERYIDSKNGEIMQQIEKAIYYASLETNDVVHENDYKRLQNLFFDKFRTCLFFHPELNNFLINKLVGNMQKEIEATSRKINKMKGQLDENEKRMSIITGIAADEFIHKLRKNEKTDGMMLCLSNLFQEFFSENDIKIDVVRYLSRIHDAYNYDYENYQMIPIGQVSKSNALYLAFNLDERNRLFELKQPLIECYLLFIGADYLYFKGIHDEAVSAYKKVDEKLRELKGSYNKEQVKNAILYIGNSIGWALQKIDDASANNTAIEEFRKIYPDNNYEDRYRSHFESIYRRNYGVCLDNAHNYTAALEQYELSIRLLPPYTYQYKPYVTYCGAVMKLWDEEYHKTSREWHENVKRAWNKHKNDKSTEKWHISAARIDTLKLYLELAEKHKADFPDTYRHMARLMSYELMIHDWHDSQSVRRETGRDYLDEIFHLISIAENLYLKKDKGTQCAKRDIYYSLYLLNFDGREIEWLKCVEENNNGLDKNRGKEEFKDMIDEIMQEIRKKGGTFD